MDGEKKARKLINYLNIPFELLDKLPDQISQLESCFNTECKESSFMLPNESNQQLPEVFLRTRLLDEATNFINENFEEEKPGWNDNIDIMISKWESFELFEPEDEEPSTKEEDLDILKGLILERE